MADELKKCAHASCSCHVSGDKEYCSEICEDSSDVMELGCNCGHSGCSGEQI